PMPRELFVISTTSERLSFPATALVRIDSFLDGVTATPENEKGDDVIEYGGDTTSFAGGPVTFSMNGVRYTASGPAELLRILSGTLPINASNKVHLSGGQSITYQDGKRVTDAVTKESGAPAD